MLPGENWERFEKSTFVDSVREDLAKTGVYLSDEDVWQAIQEVGERLFASLGLTAYTISRDGVERPRAGYRRLRQEARVLGVPDRYTEMRGVSLDLRITFLCGALAFGLQQRIKTRVQQLLTPSTEEEVPSDPVFLG